MVCVKCFSAVVRLGQYGFDARSITANKFNTAVCQVLSDKPYIVHIEHTIRVGIAVFLDAFGHTSTATSWDIKRAQLGQDSCFTAFNTPVPASRNALDHVASNEHGTTHSNVYGWHRCASQQLNPPSELGGPGGDGLERNLHQKRLGSTESFGVDAAREVQLAAIDNGIQDTRSNLLPVAVKCNSLFRVLYG